MSHIPVNHPLRGLYLTISVLIGLFLAAFGVAGVVRCWGDPFFDRGEVMVLGTRTNLAFSFLVLAVGLAVLVITVMGGNTSHFGTMWIGGGMTAFSLVMLAFLRTDANVVNMTVAACVTGMLLGMALLTAGLYTKAGTQEMALAEEQFRHKTTAT